MTIRPKFTDNYLHVKIRNKLFKKNMIFMFSVYLDLDLNITSSRYLHFINLDTFEQFT